MLKLPDQSCASCLGCIGFEAFQMLLDVWDLSSNVDAVCEHEHVIILFNFNDFTVKTVNQCSKCLWISMMNEFSSKFRLSLNDYVDLSNTAICFFVSSNHGERMALKKGPKATKEDPDEKVLACVYGPWSGHLDFKVVCIISRTWDFNNLCWAVKAAMGHMSKEYLQKM